MVVFLKNGEPSEIALVRLVCNSGDLNAIVCTVFPPSLMRNAVTQVAVGSVLKPVFAVTRGVTILQPLGVEKQELRGKLY